MVDASAPTGKLQPRWILEMAMVQMHRMPVLLYRQSRWLRPRLPLRKLEPVDSGNGDGAKVPDASGVGLEEKETESTCAKVADSGRRSSGQGLGEKTTDFLFGTDRTNPTVESVVEKQCETTLLRHKVGSVRLSALRKGLSSSWTPALYPVGEGLGGRGGFVHWSPT